MRSPAAQTEEQQQQQAQLAHQNEIRKRQEEEEKKSRTETTPSPDSYPATPNNLDSEQQPESRVNHNLQQQATATRHKKRSRLKQQQSVILDDDNTPAIGEMTLDYNVSKIKRERELFDVATETASTIQQQRRSGNVDGDQRETKLHEGESQAAQNLDHSQTNPDIQAQQFDQLGQLTTQAQIQESDTQLEDDEVPAAKRVYWRSQSNQVTRQSKQQILHTTEPMPTQSEQMPQIPEQPADALPENPVPVLPDRNENNWQAVQEHLVGDRQLPKQIVELLHAKGWIYADDEGQTVFVGRTLDGEPTGAFVLNDNTFSSIRLDPDEPAAPDEEDTTLTGCFWVATKTPIQRAVLTSDPVEVLSVMAIDPDFNQTPTLYLAADSVFAIPKEFLEKLPTVVVGLKGDEEGNAVSEEILAALPQARRINPGMAGWNKLLTDEREDIKSEVQELHKKQTGDQGLDID